MLGIKDTGRNFFYYPPLVYRAVLSAFLGIEWTEKCPEEATDIGEWIARRADFQHHQKTLEKGLLTALQAAGRRRGGKAPNAPTSRWA